LAIFINLIDILPLDINSPEMMKKGIHIRGNVSIPAKQRCAIRVSEISGIVARMVTRDASPIENATVLPIDKSR
jgi:hypothetical protein